MHADLNITWVGDNTINASLIPACLYLDDPNQCTDPLKMARVIAPVKGSKKGDPVVRIPAGGAVIWKAKTCVTASLGVLSPWMALDGYLNHRHYPDMVLWKPGDDPTATPWAFPANLTGSRPFPFIVDIGGTLVTADGPYQFDLKNVSGVVPFMCTPGHATIDGCVF
jgi:hypothetical protein